MQYSSMLNHIITPPVAWKSHNICKYYVISTQNRHTTHHQSRDFATVTRRELPRISAYLPRKERSHDFAAKSNALMLTRSKIGRRIRSCNIPPKSIAFPSN
jgi:hypothetical protein